MGVNPAALFKVSSFFIFFSHMRCIFFVKNKNNSPPVSLARGIFLIGYAAFNMK